MTAKICHFLLVTLTIFGCTVSQNVIAEANLVAQNEDNPVLTSAPAQVHYTTPQLIEFYGYSPETHKVTTDDGFNLTLHRILLKNGTLAGTRGPCYIHHGFIMSSHDFLLQIEGSQKNLPLILTKLGYDVWLGNARGNGYSMQHQTLNESDKAFWNFSFHEMGVYDFPAAVNYILKISPNAQKLNYISHSLGAAIHAVAIDHDPRLNDKINKVVWLAPGIYSSSSSGPISQLSRMTPSRVIEGLFPKAVFPDGLTNLTKKYAPGACAALRKIIPGGCDYFLWAMGGYNAEQTTNNTTPMAFGHGPSIVSGKTMAHVQNQQCRPRFAEYDPNVYPCPGNALSNKKGSRLYDLTQIRSPVLVMCGGGDKLCDCKDAQQAVDAITNSDVTFKKVTMPKWTHADFLMGKDADVFVYEHISQFLTSDP